MNPNFLFPKLQGLLSLIMAIKTWDFFKKKVRTWTHFFIVKIIRFSLIDFGNKKNGFFPKTVTVSLLPKSIT